MSILQELTARVSANRTTFRHNNGPRNCEHQRTVQCPSGALIEDEPGEKKEEKKRKAAEDDPKPPRERWGVFEPELAQGMLRLNENERARVAVFVASIKATDEEAALVSVVVHLLTEGLFARWGALKLKSLRLRFDNEDLAFMIEDLRRSRFSFSASQQAAVSEEVGEAAALLVARVVEAKHSKCSSLCRSCFIVPTESVLLGILSDFRAVSFAED